MGVLLKAKLTPLDAWLMFFSNREALSDTDYWFRGYIATMEYTLGIFLGCHFSVDVTTKENSKDESIIHSWLHARQNTAAPVG